MVSLHSSHSLISLVIVKYVAHIFIAGFWFDSISELPDRNPGDDSVF